MGAESIKSLKGRIRSIGNAGKIARAMHISASVRYRRAAEKAVGAERCFSMTMEMLAVLQAYITPKSGGKRCVIVIGGDRGMSGGYNAAVMKETFLYAGSESIFLPVGRRIAEKLRRKGENCIDGRVLLSEKLSAEGVSSYAKRIAESVFSGEIGEILIIYTAFDGEIRSNPVCKCLYPVKENIHKQDNVIFEPEACEIVQDVFDDLLTEIIFAAANIAQACEQLARRMAMDSAQKNAQQMLDGLKNRLNRSRQWNITQEIIEAVAGEQTERR